MNPHITNIQFSYDNRYIVATTSCNDAKGVISLWDLSTGTVKTEEHCFKDVLQPPIFFSKNSEYCLTFLNNEDILVYDLGGNKSLSIQNHSNISGRAKAISFSKNEEWLIVDCEDRVNVWSVEDWSCRSVMKHGETPNYNKYLGIYENEVIMLDDNRLYLSDIVSVLILQKKNNKKKRYRMMLKPDIILKIIAIVLTDKLIIFIVIGRNCSKTHFYWNMNFT